MTALGLAFLCLTTGPAAAVEAPISREALMDILKGDQIWCSEWRADQSSCDDVGFVEASTDGKYVQTYRYRLSTEPDLQMVMQETVSLEGDALCSTFSFESVELAVLLDGQPAPDEQSAEIAGIMASTMSELEGKKVCERYSRDSETGVLQATVTLDGKRAPKFDSQYLLIKPDTRIQLRPLFDDSDDNPPVPL